MAGLIHRNPKQIKVFISQSMKRTCYWSGNHYTATWIVIPVLLCHWFCLGDIDSIADSAVIHYTVWVIDVFHRLKTDRLDGQAANINSTQEWMHAVLMWNTYAWAAWGVDACWPCACVRLAGPEALFQNVESLLASLMFTVETRVHVLALSKNCVLR